MKQETESPGLLLVENSRYDELLLFSEIASGFAYS